MISLYWSDYNIFLNCPTKTHKKCMYTHSIQKLIIPKTWNSATLPLSYWAGVNEISVYTMQPWESMYWFLYMALVSYWQIGTRHVHHYTLINPCRTKLISGNMNIYLHFQYFFNIDHIWQHRTWSTMVQKMSWCLMAPRHFINQCWLIINEAPWHSSHSIFHRQGYMYQSLNR